MRRRIALLIAVSMFAAAMAVAQSTSTLRGKVVQADGTTAYAGVAVTLQSANGATSVYSASDGMFSLPNVPPGQYTLRVQTAHETKAFSIHVGPSPYTDLAPIRMR